MISHVLFAQNEMITNDYSYTHQAIDMVGAGHTVSDVIAYDDGTVIYAINNVKSRNTNTTGNATYGNFIKIKHKNNIQTLYAHLKYGSVKVKQGDTVKKGQVIGTMGDTGRAFGVHLHFEIMDYNNKRMNPYDYLWQTDNSPVLVQTNTETNVETNNNAAETVVEITENEETNEEVITEDEIITAEEIKENTEITSDITSENIIEDKSFTLFQNSDYDDNSLSDALNEIFVNNTYEYREKLAFKNGIKDYKGTKSQNLQLLELLKDGKLKAVY